MNLCTKAYYLVAKGRNWEKNLVMLFFEAIKMSWQNLEFFFGKKARVFRVSFLDLSFFQMSKMSLAPRKNDVIVLHQIMLYYVLICIIMLYVLILEWLPSPPRLRA